VAHMGEERKLYKFWWEGPRERDRLEDDQGWDQNGSQGDWLRGWGLDSTGSGYLPMVSYCECGDKPSGSCAT
jgi:hypothetical protein